VKLKLKSGGEQFPPRSELAQERLQIDALLRYERVNFFQRHQTKPVEVPVVEPSPLPAKVKIEPVDTVQPIHLDEAQYLGLTRALHPTDTPVLKDPQPDAPGSGPVPVASEASQPPPANLRVISRDQPPGTPIV
jgi:hypothetical protein